MIRRWVPLAELSAIVLLTAAHLPMREHRLPLWAAVAFGGAVFLSIGIAIAFPPAREELGSLSRSGGRPRSILLLLALTLAALAWIQAAGGTYRTAGVVAWVASVGCWLGAWWPGDLGRPATAEDASRGRRRLRALALLAPVFVVGGWFVFYDLAGTPGNPTSDHAEKLSDVLDIVNGQRPIFFIRNTGREPFQFYWTYALIRIFGLPIRYMTLKIGTALIGLAAIPALYLVGTEMGGAPLGLTVAALASWNKWPVSLSRPGLRYPLCVLPTAIVLWVLLRWLRRGDRASVLWIGAAVGAGLHGYISFRVVPLLIPVAVALALVDRRRRGRRLSVLGDAALMICTAVIMALPLLRYMADHSDQFWYRAATRAASLERPIGAEPVAIFVRNLWNMLTAFDWKGASTWTVVRQYDPFLDAVTASLWIVGIVLLAGRIVRGSLRWPLVALGLFVLTLPSTLSLAFPDENPSINRSGTAIPVVFLVAGLAAVDLVSRRGGGAATTGARVGLASLFLFSIVLNFRQYFVDFHESYDLVVDHAIQMAHVLDDYRKKGVPLRQMYLLYSDYWVDGRNIAFELGDPSWASTQVVEIDKLPPDTGARPLVFLFAPGNPILEKLEKTYPGKVRTVPQSFAARNFRVYYVP